MHGGIKLSIIVSLTVLVCIGSAQEEAPEPRPRLGTESEEANLPAFPYVARITADNVNVRSGPGTNHYPCGKLTKGDTVTVVDSYFPWSRIVPPPGSFSWISKQYVRIDTAEPNTAIVTDAAMVYVGAEGRDPIRCTRNELNLNAGEKVRLLGELTSDYYKIAPPTGAYRWVSTRYTKALRPIRPVPPPPAAPPVPAPADTNAVTSAPDANTTDTNAVVPAELSIEAEQLQVYYELEKQFTAERAKPTDQQDYADLKKAFLEIAENEQAGKAARYADLALKQIGRCELAFQVGRALELQDAQLKRHLDNIDKARAGRLAEIQDLGRFAAVGRLQAFATYGPGHYRIVDDSNRTLCAAVPAGPAARENLSTFIGQKVGLVGTIGPHALAGAVVRFAQIVPTN
ncbi:MAG: SH3 domain-containing protein [Planctomycetota bacterium]|jgi:hypothetical protein